MRMKDIAEAMRVAERNRAEHCNKAFAAKTNIGSTIHEAEASKWSNEWLRLSREAIKLVSNNGEYVK